jgi:hypothetical protein
VARGGYRMPAFASRATTVAWGSATSCCRPGPGGDRSVTRRRQRVQVRGTSVGIPVENSGSYQRARYHRATARENSSREKACRASAAHARLCHVAAGSLSYPAERSPHRSRYG